MDDNIRTQFIAIVVANWTMEERMKMILAAREMPTR